MIKIARVKFSRGLRSAINSINTNATATEGSLYFATDDGTLWYGTSSGTLTQVRDNIDHTYTANTTTVGSASSWSAGTLPSSTSVAADDITSWSAGTMSSASYSAGVATFSNGSAPSLSYTARSINSLLSAGTLPSLTITSTTVATGIKEA